MADKIWILIVIIFLIGLIYNVKPEIFQSISGKLTGISIGPVDLRSLIEHPENYLGKEVTVSGHPSENIPFQDKLFKYEINGNNEEGKPISLQVNYTHFYCMNCEITGVIKTIRTCTCQIYACKYETCRMISSMSPMTISPGEGPKKFKADHYEADWNNLPSYPIQLVKDWYDILEVNRRVEDCEIEPKINTLYQLPDGMISWENTFFRCIPNSNRDFPYLDVTKVKSLD